MNKNKFSHWEKWEDRENLNDLKFSGIYALSISKTSITNKPFSWDSKIVYFGMTNSVKGLKGRLNQFHYTISGKDSQHGGAERFLNKHSDYKKLSKILYVAIAPFKCNVESNKPKDLRIMGTVCKAEYE